MIWLYLYTQEGPAQDQFSQNTCIHMVEDLQPQSYMNELSAVEVDGVGVQAFFLRI